MFMKYHVVNVRAIPVSFVLINDKKNYKKILNSSLKSPDQVESFFNIDRMLMLTIVALIWSILLIDLVAKYKMANFIN